MEFLCAEKKTQFAMILWHKQLINEKKNNNINDYRNIKLECDRKKKFVAQTWFFFHAHSQLTNRTFLYTHWTHLFKHYKILHTADCDADPLTRSLTLSLACSISLSVCLTIQSCNIKSKSRIYSRTVKLCTSSRHVICFVSFGKCSNQKLIVWVFDNNWCFCVVVVFFSFFLHSNVNYSNLMRKYIECTKDNIAVVCGNMTSLNDTFQSVVFFIIYLWPR